MTSADSWPKPLWKCKPTEGQRVLSAACEPVVKLAESSRRGMGGRNQQLVLAALVRLADDGAEGIALLSGGTDGEDGPTNAAGALLDAEVLAAASKKGLDPNDFLSRNDAYNFFAPLDALIKTGPTHTNVCDLAGCLSPRACDRIECWRSMSRKGNRRCQRKWRGWRLSCLACRRRRVQFSLDS